MVFFCKYIFKYIIDVLVLKFSFIIWLNKGFLDFYSEKRYFFYLYIDF